ncbi:MAG TPA: serine protease, partial [Planctomicrobium sp.]|nr:serine protease [Planctomicrobium sp.]
VCLPAPRILTVAPMGGKAGTEIPVTINGENLDGVTDLLFSDARITAVPLTDDQGVVKPNQFLVKIAPETPTGVYEARLMTRLGISASRAFSVGTLPEVMRTKPNTTLQTAMEIDANSVCNAHTTARAIDYYSMSFDQPTRLVVECAALGIDSKLKPVLMIADEQGRDLVADRRHGLLDYTIPKAGKYIIKVQGLTFEGGPESYYRLVTQTLPESAPITRHPSTQNVNMISVPSIVSQPASVTEVEPNNRPTDAQKITLPCDIAGAFFPAADVDTYEFTAKKGEVWWVEVVSERFGLPTNPFVVVQQVVKKGDVENTVDVAEFNDIASPVKVSSNGYSYSGPPYNVGTSDALGKIDIKEDGTYRVQVRDLFGGTRRDPRCVYRLIIRQAEPDFSLATWALHMELRNGDRNSLSKPIALRSGGTMIFEVVAIRKDGFDGPIEISMEELPVGMSATGLKMPAGQSRGILLISAVEGGPTVTGSPKIFGRAQIGDKTVTHESRLASMAWAVVNSQAEIPNPRLMADVAVSITSEEAAPLTIAPANPEVIVAGPTDKLTIPMKLTWRGEFSGALTLKPTGAGYEKVKPLNVPLNSPTVDLPVDLGELKLPPGEHVFAMYGGLVTKYRYNVPAVEKATEELRLQDEEITKLTEASKAAAATAQSAADENKAATAETAKQAEEKLKQAQTQRAEIDKRLKAVTAAAAPKEIVDIVVSEPIRIQVNAAESK